MNKETLKRIIIDIMVFTIMFMVYHYTVIANTSGQIQSTGKLVYNNGEVILDAADIQTLKSEIDAINLETSSDIILKRFNYASELTVGAGATTSIIIPTTTPDGYEPIGVGGFGGYWDLCPTVVYKDGYMVLHNPFNFTYTAPANKIFIEIIYKKI